ncbi:hypothetical protein BJ944DRAFT_245013 [Cunninghamella echinulata]|nr:hypothetical protein BJ944DRAFT_245013 [Cunninghamella echinulata]
MEDLFQSDIIDVTQYLDRIENDQNYTVKESRSTTDIILKSINSTLDYYKRSQEAYNACHNILFRAWYRRQDAGVSFSVSRYSRGIKAEEYYQIIQQLDMTEHFKLALLALTPKNAILALQEILPSVQFSHYHIYLPFYIKTMHCLSTEETFIKAADYLYPFISNDKLDVSTLQQLLSIILTTFKSNENLTEYCSSSNTAKIVSTKSHLQ